MPIKTITSFFLCALALVVFTAVGCEKPTDGGSGKDAHGADDGHDHDEAHAHPAHGPNGGHMVPLESSDFQAEWKKYNDNNLTRIYILDATGKNPHPIAADSFVITAQVGEAGPGFTLKGENPDADGLAAVYALDDEALKLAIPLGVDIEIKVGDKTVKGEIKAHAPLDH